MVTASLSRSSRTISQRPMFVSTLLLCVGVMCGGVMCVGGEVTFPGLSLRYYVSLRLDLKEISSRLANHGLSHFLERPNLTVFLPNSEAMARFDKNQLGYDANDTETLRTLLLYHSVEGRVEREEIQNNMRIRATTPTERLLYFNTFTGNDGKTIYTINGARILTSGYTADNGILYIIDRVMYPFGSEKTVTEYDNNPDVPYLSFTSVTALQEINTPLFQQGADPGNFFTVFSPNDSYTYPISREAQQKFYTNWTLINDTIKAHIVKDKVLCLPAEGHIPEAMSLNGQLKFTRRDGKVYVENNRVRAEVIIPNIPLRNGVLHVIDNLLYFIYDTIHQKLSQLYESRTFLAITDTIPDLTSRLRSETSEMTIFVPETSAFAKVPSRLQGEVEGNITLLMSLLNSHVILGQVLDIDTLLRLENITTLGNRTIRVMKMNNGVYLQHNGLRTRVTRGDIGCTNGVVHLINDVMIDSHLTVWENIESQTQLSTVFDLMRNHVDIRTTLSAEDGSYVTVFLPGTFFLNELPGYSREMLSAGGSRVHEALIGHIVENAFMGSSDFEDGVERKMTTKSGRNIHITRRGHDIFVNGSHVTGKVTVSDIWCSNGVIHIIDGMLHIPTRNALDEMRRREDTRLASFLFSASAQQRHLLEGNSTTVSVFVPSDYGLTRIPASRAQLLRQNPEHLDKFIRAHIVQNREIYTRAIPPVGEVFSAEEGKIRIAMSRDKLYVKNAGVRAWFTVTDIPVTNGVIHVIDGPVWLAYRTVEEVLIAEPEVMPFYSFISHLPVTRATMQSKRPVTVFAPSSGYFTSIQTKLTTLRANEDFQRKLFLGHLVPNLVVNRTYINPQRNSWNFTTGHNITFRFAKETQDSFVVGIYRDYSIVMSKTDMKCTNGIIYIIEGLLNFSPYTAREVSEREANLRNIFHTLIVRSWQRYLGDTTQLHTVLAPDDTVNRKQGSAVERMLSSNRYIEEVTWRHVLLGEILTLEDLLTRTRVNNFTRNNVTFSRSGHDVFVTWGRVRGRIVRSNILTTHGIIHIVDKVLVATEPSETTSTPTKETTTITLKARTGKSINDTNAGSSRGLLLAVLIISQCFLILVKIVL